MDQIEQTKSSLRERILALLKKHNEEERLNKSLEIKTKLFSTHQYRDAQTILFYASFNGEVDTFEIMKRAQENGKTIVLPRTNKETLNIVPFKIEDLQEDLEDGPYGIKQPKLKEENEIDFALLDLVIVPGVAFDKHNQRLGRGGGYYDRFLKKISSHIPTIGLAFDFQFVDEIPHIEDHDMAVSCVITN